MLIDEQINKQINATLKITEKTLSILSNTQTELKNFQQELKFTIELIDDQITTLENKQKQFDLFLRSNENKSQKDIESQCNELLQIITSIRLQLKEELYIEQKYIDKDCLKKLFYELNKIDEVNDNLERKLYYQKIFSFKTKKSIVYKFLFNTNSTILFNGNGAGQIKIIGLNSNYKLIQTLSVNKFSGDLAWIKKSDSLVQGCQDYSIVVWDHYLKSYQKLEGHTDTVCCLILNKNEDLLIPGSYNSIIKFWKNGNSGWILQQTISVQFKFQNLSLNKSEVKLISYGYNYDILILQSSPDQEWAVTQIIHVQNHIINLNFINDDQFILQPLALKYLEIYNFQKDQQEFVKIKQIQFIYGLDHSMNCKLQVIQEKNLIIVNHQWCLIVIKYNEN